MGRDPKPTAQSLAAARAARPSDGLLNAPQPSLLEMEGKETGRISLERLLLPFLLRDDGWLRVTPQNDGESVYWKWKYTGGKHANHYVMVVCPASQSGQALMMLAAKVDAVDCGEKAPVRDHYFKG
jgi:hypothetical protein